jgi:hypothetical protein
LLELTLLVLPFVLLMSKLSLSTSFCSGGDFDLSRFNGSTLMSKTSASMLFFSITFGLGDFFGSTGFGIFLWRLSLALAARPDFSSLSIRSSLSSSSSSFSLTSPKCSSSLDDRSLTTGSGFFDLGDFSAFFFFFSESESELLGFLAGLFFGVSDLTFSFTSSFLRGDLERFLYSDFGLGEGDFCTFGSFLVLDDRLRLCSVGCFRASSTFRFFSGDFAFFSGVLPLRRLSELSLDTDLFLSVTSGDLLLDLDLLLGVTDRDFLAFWGSGDLDFFDDFVRYSNERDLLVSW